MNGTGHRHSAARIGLLVAGLLVAVVWGWLGHEPGAPASDDGTMRRDLTLMGTSFTLIAEAPEEVAVPALDAAAARLVALEEEISSWRPDSDVSRLNDAAGGEPVPVGEGTWELLRRAAVLHRATDGALDVTIGPVWDLWPFRDPATPVPDDAQLEAALALRGALEIELGGEPGRRTARLPRPGMRVNLGAIGKGWAAGVALEELAHHGVEVAAVSAGGDLTVRGRKRSGPWVVGVEDPRWPGRYLERFAAADVSVATSGQTKRHVVRDGQTWGHVLDPRSGRPVEGCVSVTVVTADPVDADGYATALLVMGAEAALRWVEAQPGVEALVVDAAFEAHRSSGWAAATPSTPRRAASP